jgi:molecular chaperone GrpE
MSDEKKPNDEPAPSPSEAGQAAPDEVSVEQLKAMIAALQTDLEKKSADVAAKQDQFLRAVAETENVRRRLEREKEETAKYAITRFAKDILSVGDNFQRAIAAVPKDAVETDPALKSLLDGVTLAERDFKSALERHGVRTIDPAGKPFDPHHHQAVMEQEDTNVPAGTVLQVYQVGYMIDDRNLRPAMVVVSRGGPKSAKTDDGAPGASDAPPTAEA